LSKKTNAWLALSIFLGLVLMWQGAGAGILSGTVRDAETHEPIPLVTIRVEGTGRSMLANESGQYRLRLDPGEYRIKFSHVAHYSEVLEISVSDSALVREIALRPSMIEISGMRVYDRQYDAGQRIILRAIEKKDEILKKIQKYHCDAYTKLLLQEKDGDSAEIFLLTETQLSTTWEYPDKYNQVILARKQTANILPEANMVAVGAILNFNQNRLEIGDNSVVSPTAKDALKYYNYYLLDTVLIDGMPVFKLEIEPKDQSDRLFVGTIEIADSSFAVVGVDVTFSEGVEFRYMNDMRYLQRFGQFDNEYWLPIEIALEGWVDVPFPGIPSLDFSYIAVLHEYDLTPDIKSGTFDFALEVDEGADDLDSAAWEEGQMMPLTLDESRGYYYHDSVASAPKPLGKQLARGGIGLLLTALTEDRFFRFNRVEGAFVGAGLDISWRKPRLDFSLEGGRAIDAKLWEYDLAVTKRLGKRWPLSVNVRYKDRVARRNALVGPPGYNPTLMALMRRWDSFDYYLERGGEISVSGWVNKQLAVDLAYRDYRQDALTNSTDYDFFSDKPHRPNPTIAPGTMRSLTASFSFDSRSVVRNKGEYFRMARGPYTTAQFNVQVSDPGLIDSDFDFVRYSASISTTQRLFGLGTTRLYLAAGASDGDLPPQRYFVVDHSDVVFGGGLPFLTLSRKNFAGNRAAVAYGTHDFGTLLFRESGIPLVKDIPFSLKLRGGVFWTEFEQHTSQPGDDLVLTAPKMYSEVGFGLGNLPPIPWTLYSTWQISDYDTWDWSIGFSIDVFSE